MERVKSFNDAAGQIVPCKLGGQRVCLMSNCIRTNAYKHQMSNKNVLAFPTYIHTYIHTCIYIYISIRVHLTATGYETHYHYNNFFVYYLERNLMEHPQLNIII